MRKKSIPCYIKNGGVHNVVNVPMGIFTRAELCKLVRRLLASLKNLETFVAAEATPRTIKLLQGLDKFLSVDLKSRSSRPDACTVLAVNEKNLKPSQPTHGDEASLNFVDFSIKCGLIVLAYVIAAHLEFLSN